MTAVDAFFRAEPKIVRGQYEINGELYTRATTFASTIDDRWNLERWQQRMVAVGLVQRSDLYAQVAANHDDKKVLDRLCDEAREAAQASASANTGTALHTLTERVDRGEKVHIPAPWDADIAAYQQALIDNGVTVDPQLMEGVVVHRGLKVAGRFDRLVELINHTKPLVSDLKTGQTLDFSWPTIAQQLAIYANADHLYDPATGQLIPMVNVDKTVALVIHLPAGQATCTLYLVDIVAGWEAVQLSAAVRSWRKRRDLTRPLEDAWQQRARHFADRVQYLKDHHPQALVSLALMWPAGVPTFKQGGPRTADETNLVALAVSTAEAQHKVAFPEDGDPFNLPADQQVRDDLERRLKTLPADLLEKVRVRVPDMPNVQSSRFANRHAAQLEGLLGEAEAAHDELRCVVMAYTTAIGVSGAQQDALFAVCGTDGTTWTAQQVELLGHLADLAADGGLVFVNTDHGVVATCLDAEQRLVDLYGAKRDALAAVKELADQFGLPKPRALNRCVDLPALVALAAGAAITETSESEQS